MNGLDGGVTTRSSKVPLLPEGGGGVGEAGSGRSRRNGVGEIVSGATITLSGADSTGAAAAGVICRAKVSYCGVSTDRISPASSSPTPDSMCAKTKSTQPAPLVGITNSGGGGGVSAGGFSGGGFSAARGAGAFANRVLELCGCANGVKGTKNVRGPYQ